MFFAGYKINIRQNLHFKNHLKENHEMVQI